MIRDQFERQEQCSESRTTDLLGHGDGRVRAVRAVGGDSALGDSLAVAVEGNLVGRVNELALSDRLPERDEDVLRALDVVLAKPGLESLSGLPGVVVGNLAGDVVENVGLSNAVEQVGSNGSEPVPVNRAEGTTGEGPGLGLVVRKHRVRVLKVSDHDQPVVAPEVRNDVVPEDIGKATGSKVSAGSDSRESQANAEVRNENLVTVALVEDDRLGVEVVRVLGVVKLTRGVLNQVEGPAEKLLHKDVDQVVGGGILEHLVEPLAPSLLLRGLANLLLDLLLLARVRAGLRRRSKGKKTPLLTSAGNENFITSEVTRSSVVTSVRDSPRVVRNEESRVQDPANGVVEGLGGTEALVATLVSNDPETGENHALEDPVDGPSAKSGQGLLYAKREIGRQHIVLLELLGDSGVNERSSVAESGDHRKVTKDIAKRLDRRTLKTVLRNRREEVLDGELGHVESGEVLLLVRLRLLARVANLLGALLVRSGSGHLARPLSGSSYVGGSCSRHDGRADGKYGRGRRKRAVKGGGVKDSGP